MEPITVAFTICAGAITAPLLTLLIQACAALFLRERESQSPVEGTRPRTAIVIPAHNEESSIVQTIHSVKAQMLHTDRLVVVADNCSDRTETLANQAGAEVAIRRDEGRRGKGYALDAGLRHLAQTQVPDIVAIIDADCVLGSPDSLGNLARFCASRNAPIQARCLVMRSSPDDRTARIAEFAWQVKAILRPTGYMRLGLPCPLMGTGMAFPWALISRYNLAIGHITEDAVLGLEMILDGHPPWFCSTASVISTFPASEEGRERQRKRWIHGYLSVAQVYLPRLLRRSLRHRELSSVAMAADLAVPPLGLLAVLWVLAISMSCLWYLVSGSYVPLLLSMFNGMLLAVFAMLAWLSCGRNLIGVRELAIIPRYIGAVVRIFWHYAVGDRSGWTRADRSKRLA
jgi:cellulose synthase/poly-beta-1,6-N-acetylglucosamine synthase-like glycosyltransferase